MDRSAPYSRAIEAIRERLATGHVAPGANLVVGEIAVELELSQTPVREALIRLAGEGLIEDRRGKGYFAWPLGAADLNELYQAHRAYVRMALEVWVTLGAAGVSSISETATAFSLFDQLVRSSGNGILRENYRRLTERMARVRLAEAAVMRDIDAEAAELRRGLLAPDTEVLNAAIEAYHDSRLRWTGLLAAAVNQSNYR